MAKRILTGDRPTGPLHLGHYFGTLENRVVLQNKGFDCFIIIADYQVLTDRLETDQIKQNIINIAKDYISIGLDPLKSTFFVQSDIPELAELTLLFSMLVTVARVSRNPTVKEEIRNRELEENFSVGMFSYPVSQAADILLFNADFVPVGEDQLPHIELTREVAKKFNTTYNEIFKLPEPMLGNAPRLKGIDGNDKMSKSRNNAIFLSDSPELIKQKIMRAKTDTGSEIAYDIVTKPEISNLMTLFSLVSKKSIESIQKEFVGRGYRDFKEELANAIISFLKPIQEIRDSISDEKIMEILKEGNSKARSIAQSTMREVKNAMNLAYGL